VEFNLWDLGEDMYKENLSTFSGKEDRKKREEGRPK